MYFGMLNKCYRFMGLLKTKIVKFMNHNSKLNLSTT